MPKYEELIIQSHENKLLSSGKLQPRWTGYMSASNNCDNHTLVLANQQTTGHGAAVARQGSRRANKYNNCLCITAAQLRSVLPTMCRCRSHEVVPLRVIHGKGSEDSHSCRTRCITYTLYLLRSCREFLSLKHGVIALMALRKHLLYAPLRVSSKLSPRACPERCIDQEALCPQLSVAQYARRATICSG